MTDLAARPVARVRSQVFHEQRQRARCTAACLVDTPQEARAFPRGHCDSRSARAAVSSRTPRSTPELQSYSSATRRPRASRRGSDSSRTSSRSAGSTGTTCRARMCSRSAAARASSCVAACASRRWPRHRHRPRLPARAHRQPRGRPRRVHQGSLRRALRALQADAVVLPAHARAHPPGRRLHAHDPPRDRRPRPETVVLFELPDVLRVLDESARSGTSTTSTARTSRRARSPACSGARGFEVLAVELDYDDQYLLSRPGRPPTRRRRAPLPVEDDLDGHAGGESTTSRRTAPSRSSTELARRPRWRAASRRRSRP